MALVLVWLIKSSLILATAAIAAKGLRRHSAAARHLVWTCGLIGTLVLPLASIALPSWELAVVTFDRVATDSVSDDISSRAAAQPLAIGSHLDDRAANDGVGSRAAADALRRGTASLSWPAVAMAVWMAGVIVLLTRLLVGSFAVRMMARRAEHADAAQWVSAARELASDLGLSNVVFRTARSGTMPIACGIRRPMVMMPAEADTWPSERLHVVLLHELAHVKRGDLLTHILTQIACAVHWINPLARVAIHRARLERERACDDMVLAWGTPDVTYADQLLEIARAMRRARLSAAVAGASLAMAHRSQLEGRLMAILDRSIPRSSVSRTRTLTAGTFAFAALLPFAAVQPWAYSVVPQKPVERPANTGTPAKKTVVAEAQKPAERPPRINSSPVTADVAEGIAEAVVEAVAGVAASGAIEAAMQSVPAAVADALQQEVAAQKRTSQPDPSRSRRDEAKPANPRAIAALMTALKDSDEDVRRTAILMLMQLRAPGMFEPLLDALKDPSEDVRASAALALGELGDTRALDALTAALKDESAGVRQQATLAIGQLAR